MPTQEKLNSNLVATYVQAYNPYLDEIFALDPSYENIIHELKQILKAYSTLSTPYAPPTGSKVTVEAQQNLQTIYDFIISEDVESKYTKHYREIISSRLKNYIEQIEGLNASEISAFVSEQKKTYANKQAIIAENLKKQLALFQFISNKHDVNLSDSEKQEMREFRIDPRTKRSEVIVCIQIAKLLKAIRHLNQEMNDIEYNTQELSDEQLRTILVNQTNEALSKINNEYNSLLANTLNVDSNESTITYEDLPELDDKIEALLSMFNASLLSVDLFNKLNLNDRQCLIIHSYSLCKVLPSMNQTIFFDLLLPCVRINWELQKISTIESALKYFTTLENLRAQAHDLLSKHKIFGACSTISSKEIFIDSLQNTIALIINPSIDIAQFCMLDDWLKDLIILNYNKMCQLVENHGLNLGLLSNRDEDFIKILLLNYDKLLKLLENTDLMINVLLARDNVDIIVSTIEDADRICNLLASGNISLLSVFNPEFDDGKLYTLIYKLEWLQTLVSYYFIPQDYIINLEGNSLNKMLNNCNHAPNVINANVKLFDTCLLQTTITNQLSAAMQDIIALRFDGKLMHITNISEMPSRLTYELKSIGLNFQQTRVIYESFIDINQVFANKYINNYTDNDQIHLYIFPTSFNAITQLFEPTQANAIRAILNEYIAAMKQTLQARVGMPANWQENLKYFDMYAFANLSEQAIEEANEFNLMFIQDILATATTETLSTKHIMLFEYVLDSKIFSNLADDLHWKKIASNWRSHLHRNINSETFANEMSANGKYKICKEASVIQQIYTYMYYAKCLIEYFKHKPSSHMGVTHSNTSNPLFCAIHQDSYHEVNRIIHFADLSMKSPLGLCPLVYAAIEGNRSVFFAIKSTVLKKHSEKLSSYLADNNFQDLQAYNDQGDTVITAAIKMYRLDIVQATLAYAIKNIHGEIVVDDFIFRNTKSNQTPLQIAISADNQDAIANICELIKMTPLHHTRAALFSLKA